MTSPRRLTPSPRTRAQTQTFLAALVAYSSLAAACAGARALPPAARPASPCGPSVVEIRITVGDLEQATRFFTDVLGARRREAHALRGPALATLAGLKEARATSVRLELGAEQVVLTRYEHPSGRPIPADARSSDLEFQHLALVVRDMDRAHARVAAANILPVSPGPQRIPDSNPVAGGIRAFYFRDPEGHPLELLWFPTGRGDPRWQAASGPEPVLGIDHTAIVVRDTERSLGFWRDLLGLHVTSTSLNEGREQEQLSGVPGARVRITGLRGQGGSGVELLEYLAPGPGRPRPADSTPADLLHDETTVEVADLGALAERLEQAGVPRLSSAIASCEDCLESRRALLVRDPDGHVVRLVGR